MSESVDRSSRIVNLEQHPNAATRLVEPGPSFDAMVLDEAYVRAREAGSLKMVAPGVRLVWCRGNEVGWHDLVAHPNAYAIIGRHTSADIVLPGDPNVALRHLIVRATTLEDGSPAVRVLDLRSHQGFFLEDDTERRTIVASGILAMRVGRYALFALPSNIELPVKRPTPELSDAVSLPMRAPWNSGPTTSSITIMPPIPTIEDIALDRAAPGTAKVTLRHGHHWASVDLPEAALDSGVLIGRAEKCETTLRRVLTASISRVHVLLLREHEVVHAFDVASSQGLFANDQRVRRVLLTARGATLRLASKEPVMLEWHPSGSPTA